MPVHPEPERRGASRAGAARRDLSGLRPTARSQGRSLRPVHRLLRLSRVPVHQERAPKSTGITCPQCGQGQIVERHTRFGLVAAVRPLPGLRFRGQQPPVADHPCPSAARCWCVGRSRTVAGTAGRSWTPSSRSRSRVTRGPRPRPGPPRRPLAARSGDGEEGDGEEGDGERRRRPPRRRRPRRRSGPRALLRRE